MVVGQATNNGEQEGGAIKKGIKNPASGGGHINSKFQNNVIINSEEVECKNQCRVEQSLVRLQRTEG